MGNKIFKTYKNERLIISRSLISCRGVDDES